MWQKAGFACVLMTTPVYAIAEWSTTFGYLYFDDMGNHGHPAAAVLSAGYQFPMSDSFSVTPAARAGFGVKDGRFAITTGTTVDGEPVQIVSYAESELDEFLGIELAIHWQLSDRFYAALVPSYSYIAIALDDADAGFPQDFRESATGVGLGVGAGYHLSKRASVELTYEQFNMDEYSDPAVLALQARLTF